MTQPLPSETLVTLMHHLNVNIPWSEELPEHVAKLSVSRKESLIYEFRELLEHGSLSKESFLRFTACDAKDEASAKRFFEDVYNYAFEGGEEPDLTNYWNR